MSNESYLWNTRSIYGDAFNGELTAIWFSTPFLSEVEDMSYVRAISCFMQDSEDAEEARRKLLYIYLRTFCKSDAATDPLNVQRPILPSHNRNFQRAINNICTLYNQAPARDYNDLSETLKAKLESLLDDIKINRHLKHAYKLAKCVNEVIMRPYQINGKWNIEILTPDLYRIENDLYTKEIKSIWIPFVVRDRWGVIQQKFYVWTAETLRVADSEGAYQKFTFNGVTYPEAGLNHNYKRIPYVRLMMSENPDVIGGALWELAKAQLEYNSGKYIAQENLHYAALGLWFFKDIANPGEILLNPGRAYVKSTTTPDENPEISFISGTPIYNDVQAYNELAIRDTMKSFGLPNSMIMESANLQSGVSMLIDRMELNEQRNDDIDILQEFEEDLINLIAIVANVELNTGFPHIEVNTDYIEPSIFMEAKDELEHNQALFDKGLLSPSQYVQRLTGNDNIKTDQEAIEFINNNLKLKGELSGSVQNADRQTAGTTEGSISHDGIVQLGTTANQSQTEGAGFVSQDNGTGNTDTNLT